MKQKFPGWNRKTMGKIAMEVKSPIGTIACPHCGSVVSGSIQPICCMCDKPYWSEKDIRESIEWAKKEQKLA
jgi:hypothetical protein